MAVTKTFEHDGQTLSVDEHVVEFTTVEHGVLARCNDCGWEALAIDELDGDAATTADDAALKHVFDAAREEYPAATFAAWSVQTFM